MIQKIKQQFDESFMGEENEKAKACRHYSRKCSIVFDCCNKKYPCRLCHDIQEDHMISCSIKDICCNICGTQQTVSNKCIYCKTKFGNYFCHICKLWCSDGDYYHCEHCKLCRVGPEKCYYHCMACDACLDIRLKNKHKHVENTLKSDCPICAEYLFTSPKDIMFLECGHSIHLECFMSYVERSLQCPVCMKSMIKPKKYYEKITNILKNTKNIQKEKETWTCEISCYDCCADTKTQYRYLFNKCNRCLSYNTRLNEIHKN